MGSSDFILPSSVVIRHKFLTASPNLTIYSEKKEKLFKIECPVLKMRKTVYIFKAGKKEDLVLIMTPVGGLSPDIMISLPGNEILGVLKREMDFMVGRSTWKVFSGNGEMLLELKPTGSKLDHIWKKLTLFSSIEDRIFAGKKQVGSYITHAGYFHEWYEINLKFEHIADIDHRVLLALFSACTSIFYRVFT